MINIIKRVPWALTRRHVPAFFALTDSVSFHSKQRLYTTDSAQHLEDHGDNHVKEGKATVLFPGGNKIFYNPVQQYNRDVSILGIRAWSKIFQEDNGTPTTNEGKTVDPFIDIIEAFSATGLRAIRYGLEIPNVRSVIANDFSQAAVESIERNAKHSGAHATVRANQDDASMLMYAYKTKNVHVVDLDPYGSATPFMDAAVQAVRDDGLLLVTCTDLSVLAGNRYPEKCFSHYGGTTLHSEACHESAIRLVLNMIASTAARYGRSIEPMLSLSIDFYVRIFVRVNNSPIKVKQNAANTMIVYHCTGCGSSVNQPLGKAVETNNKYKFGYARGPTAPDKCSHCGSHHHIAGPMWGGPIHNDKFIDTMLDINQTLDPQIYGTKERVRGMLTVARDELKDAPFYFSAQILASVLRSTPPPHSKIISAICNAGYQASATHAHPSGIKTNAPYDVLWDILRQWIKLEHNGQISKNLKSGSPGWQILKTLDTK